MTCLVMWLSLTQKHSKVSWDTALSRCYFRVYRTHPGMGTTHPFPSVLGEQILCFHNYVNICWMEEKTGWKVFDPSFCVTPGGLANVTCASTHSKTYMVYFLVSSLEVGGNIFKIICCTDLKYKNHNLIPHTVLLTNCPLPYPESWPALNTL